MLIRVRGYHDGIKAYLEDGQKQDREFERDEMDERVILAGDLALTNDIIQSMDTQAERYINVTLSFKEDEVSGEVLADIVREFEAFAFAAYRPDEYNFYAEAHVPRLKSYADRRSGELVERKVHLHVVIPEVNLLTGRRLEPFGKVDRHHRFLEAFQEHINAKYGLASPKDNRRVLFTDASEMISRYKGDVFEPMNRELKAAILEALIARDVKHYEDFKALLTEFGATRTRNAGRDGEYENIRPPGAAKGVNLKEFVFSREFIELDADGKREALDHNVHEEYIEPGVPRVTPQHFLDALFEWNDMRAREIKYLNSGSSFYKSYQAASPVEQRRILEHREQRFYDAAGGLDERTRRSSGGSGNWRDWRERQRPQPWYEPQLTQHEHRRRWRRGADHDLDARFDRPRPPTGCPHGVRGVPGRSVDGDTARRQMLLPADALLELGDHQADRIDSLRWTGDRERTGREQLDPRSSGSNPLLDAIAARMYGAWDKADDAARVRLAATAADKFMRRDGSPGDQQHAVRSFGLDPRLVGSRLRAALGPRNEICSLADVQSLDAVKSLPFASSAAGNATPTVPFNARARSATGREADTVRDQFARDLVESRSVRRSRERTEFAEIRATLDASRLLAALAHSHGLIVDKYDIGKGEDGGDRIRAGSRNLNVSDFLTKEMNLSWDEAAHLLRDAYRAQTGRSPGHAPRHTPERDLWGEFQQWRAAYRDELRRAWDAQARHDKTRRIDIKAAFYRARNDLADRNDLPVSERREKLSAARVARLEAEAALRERIANERHALKAAARRPIADQYQDFLRERARAGDARALRELRRMQQIRLQARSADDERGVIFSGPSHGVQRPSASDRNEIIYHGPTITYEVRASGEVDYRKDGTAFLVDEGRSLRLWDSERDAIEIALRFAQQKFGATLSLSGPEAFQAAAACIAADTRMRIVFDQPELESIRQMRLAELDAEAQDRRTARRERDARERDELRDAMRNTQLPVRDGQPTAAQDAEPPAEPDAPGSGPDIKR
ncbi:LPD7 domain-containing protein [Paraburkholderia caribensis]|uniref:Relaxase/mobilization nuclease family protein n=2 Tax=Paraburkholderia TaxID=1822464 RepID=B2JXY9_PARP8|nr:MULTISPECIES: LPD7 domain-containing protein [Paraburkholderia]ACC76497.1 Relaxase/mobilization nuclease family protein [Paraburkholderia phymatum STM815]MCO4879339.1 relaxase/mobilization nuclease domain-containing protein [Paraburkholderia caribensis]PTB24003.1 relaxase [Paraburkholderia caribensis]